MKKILATILKEWTLTRRDVAGFMLLFLMPAILIIVMALVQDAPFKDYQELHFDLLVADHDNGSLSKAIKDGLHESKKFRIIDSIDNKPVTEEQLKTLLQEGTYKVGLVIPKGTTAEMVNAANIVANSVSEKVGLGRMPAREMRDSLHIKMYFDPVAKPTFRMSISFALDKYITFSCSKVLVDRLSKMGSAVTETEVSPTNDFEKVFRGIGVEEEQLNDNGVASKFINSVQHNVPAWAIFGMFFIVIPIAGHSIRERDEGSALRIELIPGARSFVALGKILFYTIVCTIQFFVMICIGLWVMPLIGLPSLYLGVNSWSLLPLALAIGVAATSYGYFVGSVFKTTNQAMPFGAISIVILSAMGGIWVPVDLLSPTMQNIALASPLRWGLDGVNHIILRNGGFTDIIPNILVLLGFSIILWMLSIYKGRKRQHSVQ